MGLRLGSLESDRVIVLLSLWRFSCGWRNSSDEGVEMIGVGRSRKAMIYKASDQKFRTLRYGRMQNAAPSVEVEFVWSYLIPRLLPNITK